MTARPQHWVDTNTENRMQSTALGVGGCERSGVQVVLNNARNVPPARILDRDQVSCEVIVISGM